jgi:hypothetical protein
MMFETAFMLMLQDISCNMQSVTCIGQKLNSSKKTKESLVFQGPHLLNYVGNALKNHISFDNIQEETMAENSNSWHCSFVGCRPCAQLPSAIGDRWRTEVERDILVTSSSNPSSVSNTIAAANPAS